MQLCVNRAGSLSAAGAIRRPAAAPCPVRIAARSFRAENTKCKRVIMRAAEEATAEQEFSNSEVVGSSPLERARQALEDENVDKEVLTSCLADLEAEMGRLQDSVRDAQAKASSVESSFASAKDQLLRLTADFENFRRRSKEEKDAVADSVRGDVVTQLLPLVDNFELARTQVKAETEAEQKINNSYQGLYKQMVDMMRSLGIEAVPTTGTPFDPMVHEAIMREANDEMPDGTVLQEFRKGFRLGEKLLRPAMVKVSVNDGPVASSEE